MAEMITGIVVQKRFLDGTDVLTWFNLHTMGATALTLRLSGLSRRMWRTSHTVFSSR